MTLHHPDPQAPAREGRRENIRFTDEEQARRMLTRSYGAPIKQTNYLAAIEYLYQTGHRAFVWRKP